MPMDLSKFRTAHNLARDLLLGPDLPVILAMPAIDLPGHLTAFPVKAQTQEVGCPWGVLIVVDEAALDPAPSDTQIPPSPPLPGNARSTGME